MKAQLLNGQLVGMGLIEGTPAQGVYAIANPEAYSAFSTFEIVDDVLHFTPEVQVLNGIATEWAATYSDYKQARKAMQEEVSRVGFAQLSPQEQRLACEWFATSKENIDTTLTLEEQLLAGETFDALSKEARLKRYTKVFNYFRAVLSTADCIKLIQVIDGNGLKDRYVEKGFEGDGAINYKGDTDIPSILDFVKGNAPFTTNGVPALNLTPLYNLTVQDLIDYAITVIKHGNY